jgi:hypothetical protein
LLLPVAAVAAQVALLAVPVTTVEAVAVVQFYILNLFQYLPVLVVQ